MECYPGIVSFSQALEISRQYLLLQTVILQKRSLGAPESCPYIMQAWECVYII